jgi:hypothetical protein
MGGLRWRQTDFSDDGQAHGATGRLEAARLAGFCCRRCDFIAANADDVMILTAHDSPL